MTRFARTMVLAASVFALSLAPAVAQEIQTPDGITLIEDYNKDETAQVSIPYEKYVLDNGLTVILHEDDSDPLVHVNLTYKVGSSREEPGKSGFAHFFEHMMFQGSEHVADEEHFKIISEAGGDLNGTTSSDTTNYWQSVPSNQLETVLYLESDRMGFLLPAVTQEKFEIQRSTVKNERAQNYDNEQYALLEERLNEAFFPEGHPYSWPTIGYVEDLDRVNVNDLKQFFLRWYGPNNATLVIAGDFDREQTLEWVSKYFGPIPRGPEVEDLDKPIFSLDENIYITHEDPNASIPLMQVSWPTVYVRHEDEAPLDVLMFIMGVGETSLVYKNLVKRNFAIAAGAEHPCEELACKFSVYAMPNPNGFSSLETLELLIDKTFEEFESRPLEDDDFERTKAEIISRTIYGLESVHGKAAQLAYYETMVGDPSEVSRDIIRYENVTKDDVMRVYNKYLKGKPRAVISIVPAGRPDLAAQPATWTRPERDYDEVSDLTAEDLNIRVTPKTFDRSVRPTPGPAPIATLPELWRETLPNGLQVIGVVSDEVPTTSLAIYMPAGQRQESPGEFGLANLTANMMNDATQFTSLEEMSNQLQKWGSSIDFFASEEYTTLYVRSLTDYAPETIDLAAERLLFPAFETPALRRTRNRLMQRVDGYQAHSGGLAHNAFNHLMYGPNNPITYSVYGEAGDLYNLDTDDVRSFYNRFYSPDEAGLVVVSDLSKDELMPMLEKFGEWTGPEVTNTPLSPFPDYETGVIYFTAMPEAEQAQIIVGRRAMPFDATGEYFLAQLANYNLGESFNGRINLKLREEKGFTYGASSTFDGGAEWGKFYASSSVRQDAVGEALTDLLGEIRGYYEEGVTDEDIQIIRNTMGQSEALSYETPYQKLGFISAIFTYDLPDDFATQEAEIITSVEKDELNAIVREYLNPDDMVYVVSGNRNIVLPQLQELGLPIVEVDEEGRPKGQVSEDPLKTLIDVLKNGEGASSQ